MSDTWTLIANPTAGGGHGRRVAARATLALQDAGQAIELRYTRKQGHATELARDAVADGALPPLPGPCASALPPAKPLPGPCLKGQAL